MVLMGIDCEFINDFSNLQAANLVVYKVRQIPTGIDGLDKMVNGGLQHDRCILICGGPGSGKTILSMQFLYNGAVRYNESGLYISLDENRRQLKEEMAVFGWDIEKLEKSGRIAIVDASPIRYAPAEGKIAGQWVGKRNFSIVSLIEIIKRYAEEIDAKRIVVDPITALIFQYDNVSERRTAILDLVEALTNLGTTSLITTEIRSVVLEREIRAEEFLVHGVVVLHVFVSEDEIVRGLQIEKMRGIAHDDQIRPYKITGNGIAVFPQERVCPISLAAHAFQI